MENKDGKERDFEILNNIYEFIGEFEGKRNKEEKLEEKMEAILQAWKKKAHYKPSEMKNMVPKQMYELMTGHSGMEKGKKKRKRRSKLVRKTKKFIM